MRFIMALIVPLVLLVALKAGAQEEASGTTYTLRETADGLVMVETATGAVAACRRDVGGWRCDAVADERRALQGEIGRLQAEVRRLKAELAAARAGPEAPRVKDYSFSLPSNETADRVMAFFDDVMRRFFAMVRSIKEQRGDGAV
jgi:hypothetical protein